MFLYLLRAMLRLLNLQIINCNFVMLNNNIMRLSDLQKQELIEDYKNGMTWNALCEKYQTNLHTVHKIFKKNNVQKTRIQDSAWSLEKQKLLTDMYLANCTYQEMYDALNCKGGTLTYWVHKLGLPMRGSGRNNVYPNKFLEHTPESDYWLGYIFADGHVGIYKEDKKSGHYVIGLSSEKKYVVEKYKEWYNNLPSIYEQPYILKDGTKKTIYLANLVCKELAYWFRNELKIDNTKHHTLNPPIEINWDIIRGFFDGDGSSAKGQWQLKSCSKIWLERIQNFLNSFGINSVLKKSYLDCWGLFVYDKENIKKLVPLMYEHKYYCHEYKYKNFESIINS